MHIQCPKLTRAAQTMVFKYDDEEWANLVPPDPAWTREETDYLLDTCAVYQLRFLVIADRYDVRV